MAGEGEIREIQRVVMRAGYCEPSPGLLSRRAVDVIKWTENWAERVGEGGMTLTSLLEAVVSNDCLPGSRIPGLSRGGDHWVSSRGQ